ncbi:MAG: HDOD domain-containing protein [Dehalococcoidia bacterium]|nr:HDOD domain-containing protein [Dehalococcoidia bacterium]
MASASQLPALPAAKIRALSFVSDPNPSIEDLLGIVHSDPALTAGILRAANSAASAPVDRIKSAQTAVVRIGAAETRRIVLGIALSGSFGNLQRSGINEDELWRHLVATAVLADAIAYGSVEHSSAFTAGLLHDIGRLAMAAQWPDQYSTVVQLARRGIPSQEAERMCFGFDHVQHGAAIGDAWGFPEEIVETIANHHGPSHRGLSWAVIRARELAGSLGISDGLVPAVPLEEDSEASMLPVIEDLGGESAVLERVGWYSGALSAA